MKTEGTAMVRDADLLTPCGRCGMRLFDCCTVCDGGVPDLEFGLSSLDHA